MRKRVIFGLGFLLLLVSFLVDEQIVWAIASNRLSFLNDFMIWISYVGSAFFILIFMTSLFLFEERKRGWIVPLWLSVLVSFLLCYLLKILIGRERPDLLLEGATLPTDFSFPSGHTAVAFSTLPILDKEFPMLKWFWLGFACLVGFSRVYIGVHYLSDIIAGALLGGLVGCLFLYLREKDRIPFC